ncbi:MAG: hypothetical protein RR404_02795 [Bacilli bacterium]
MRELSKKELINTKGGGIGFCLLIGAGIVFIIGVIDGIVRPLQCRY